MSRFIHATSLVLVLVLFSPLGAQYAFDFIAPEVNVPVAPGETTVTFTLGFEIAQTAGPLAQTQGFSMGVEHDPAVLEVEAIEYGSGVIDDEWGEPDFFSTAALADGWIVGVVFAFLGSWTVEFPEPAAAIDITYSAGGDTPIFPGLSSPLTWTNGLGSPPVANTIVVGGASLFPTWVNGSVTLADMAFIRGDMNGDGALDIADVFTAEDYLFLAGPTPGCLAALDSNSDQQIDIADIIFLLEYLFLSGTAPADPFPICGPEPVGSELGCGSYDCP